MLVLVVAIALVAILLRVLFGGGGVRPSDDRYYTGAEYDPVQHQVLRENVLNDP